MTGMGSSSSFTVTTSKIEQIVGEFFAKCLHVILDSRIPSEGTISPASSAASSSFGMKSKDRWFNLVLGDCPSAHESMEAWRQSSSDYMAVDVLLVRSPGWHVESLGGGEAESEDSYGTVLERWIISHERYQGMHSMSSSERRLEVAVVYKRAVILIRTLYASARLLPAFRLFHLANSSSQNRSFSLSYRLSTSPPPLVDEAAMDQMNFTHVETPTGRLCVSVAYRHTTAITALEVTPPVLPRIITDYVGSPTTDPLRRVATESLTGSVQGGGIAGRRGVHVVSLPSSGSGSPAGLGRRHSWGGGVNRMAPALYPPSSPSFKSSRSPSPSHLSPLYYTGHPQSCPTSQPIPIHHERRLSPPNAFSPPGTSHSLESSLTRLLPKQGSAPVSIPKTSRAQLLAADKSSRPPPSPSPRRSFDQPGASAGRTGPRLSASTLVDSLLDDSGEGAASSLRRSLCGSPRVSLSRSSSSRLQDETDEEEFACPFAVDDEVEEIRSRSGSPRSRSGDVFEASGPKSQQAALGSLVRQLRLASPLFGSIGAGSSDSGDLPSPGRLKSRPIPGAQYGFQKRQEAKAEITQDRKLAVEGLEELELHKETQKFLFTR